MENRPSLQEIKEYFKNAEKCKSTMGSKFRMTEYDLENAYFSKINAIAVNKKNSPTAESKHLYDLDSKKYAKILSYKKPKDFKITKEQIKEIHEYCNSTGLKNTVEEWFPKAFQDEKKELVTSIFVNGIEYVPKIN